VKHFIIVWFQALKPGALSTRVLMLHRPPPPHHVDAPPLEVTPKVPESPLAHEATEVGRIRKRSPVLARLAPQVRHPRRAELRGGQEQAIGHLELLNSESSPLSEIRRASALICATHAAASSGYMASKKSITSLQEGRRAWISLGLREARGQVSGRCAGHSPAATEREVI